MVATAPADQDARLADQLLGALGAGEALAFATRSAVGQLGARVLGGVPREILGHSLCPPGRHHHDRVI